VFCVHKADAMTIAPHHKAQQESETFFLPQSLILDHILDHYYELRAYYHSKAGANPTTFTFTTTTPAL
jgi:hypothetical protein